MRPNPLDSIGAIDRSIDRYRITHHDKSRQHRYRQRSSAAVTSGVRAIQRYQPTTLNGHAQPNPMQCTDPKHRQTARQTSMATALRPLLLPLLRRRPPVAAAVADGLGPTRAAEMAATAATAACHQTRWLSSSSSSSSSSDDGGGGDNKRRRRLRFEAEGGEGPSLKAFIRRAQVLALYRSFMRVRFGVVLWGGSVCWEVRALCPLSRMRVCTEMHV